MKNRLFVSSLVWVAIIVTGHAQPSEISALIRQAQERSSLVKAAQSVVDARKASLTGARSNPSPILELSPGLGFTNGNSVLSQELDLFGRRRAASTLAQANLRIAEIEVARARTQVSRELLTGVADLLSASDEIASVRVTLESAGALQAAVAKQHEVGEAPKVHVTRAELDVLRATQMLTASEGRLRAALAAVQSLVGQELTINSLVWPANEQTGGAARSFELLEATQQVSLFEAQLDVIRSEYAPLFSAGVSTDAWSLDRNAFKGDNFGLQFSLRIPLFDSGQRRGALSATRSEAIAARARVGEAQRIAELELAKARTAFKTAKTVAASYVGDVLPKAESMLIAMRQGYASGLVTLVEVLEAQQTLAKLRQENIQAVLNLRLAEVGLWTAQLKLPGTEVPQ